MLQVSFRFAQVDDLDGVIALLNQDHLGKTRESLSEKVLGQYQQAFKEILNSPYFDVLLMEEVITHELLGCAQLMYLPHLSFKGSTRMQVESVRVEEKFRGKGLGKKLMKQCTEIAKQKNCKIIQLTSNKSREDAHRFYVNLGYKPTHNGYKLYL